MFLIVNNDNRSEINQRIENALKQLGQTSELVDSNTAMTLEKMKSFQGVILSGGPWDLTQPMLFGHFKLDIQVMINANVPIYGICMGHQIMAEANGAKIGRWPSSYIGEREIKILDHSSLFEGLPDKITMAEWHQEFVIAPPPGFELIATSAEVYDPLPSLKNITPQPSPAKGCLIQGLQHKEKRMYSTQFHPELSGEVGMQILQNFVNLCS
jgi:GMP synthase (glutamine-hydrolysing)